MLTEVARDRELGRGRSAVVYRSVDDAGRDVARKVFVGDAPSKVVNYVFFGAPNAYTWNEDATRCALHRRRILSELVEVWFGSTLRVAPAFDVRWNAEHRAFEMDTGFVPGRHAALHQPFSAPGEGEYRDLRKRVMRPLQCRLAEAGLDGLVWQAGRGNPVAVSNFLHAGSSGDGHRWAWIDLESGVPALFPINPVDLLTFYLPKSWRHGRALFDDVDIDKLRGYVRDQRPDIEAAIGAERFEALIERIDRLGRHQDAWRSMRRVVRSITYRLGRGQITPEQSAWYRDRPLRWYAREACGTVITGFKKTGHLLARLARKALAFDYPAAVRAVARYLSSQRYRADLARRYVALRIDQWEQRRQLSAADAGFLRERLKAEETGSYITDFGVHIAIKPLVKFVQWIMVPALLAAGVLTVASSGLVILFGGMTVRTLYTTGRMIQAALNADRLPWVAWLVGLLPMAGNAAYPAQILFRGAEQQGKLAAFVLYDSATRVGQLLPIWGGRDTATEHRLNRVMDLVVRHRYAAAAENSRKTAPSSRVDAPRGGC